jgi:hypothetical protein
MAIVSQSSLNNKEKIGRKRFESGIEFEKIVINLGRTIQDRLLQNLPSNYSKDPNTNLAEIARAIAEEFARLQSSISETNEDQYHATTKAEYLYQILGDTLFLDTKSINYSISDVEYRNFLISVRNAYYGGSRKDNIEQAISEIVGIPVTVKELYLDLRKNNTSVTIKDTHKMFFDILMDCVSSTSSLGLLLEDIKFFLDLIKPAHTLYDTRLIWTDTIQTQNNSCTPVYTQQPIPEVIYGVDKIDMITYVVDRLYLYTGTDPREQWISGVVSSTNLSRGIIYLVDNTILVVTSESILYRRTYDIYNIPTDESISLGILNSGDNIKYYATKDDYTTSSVITTDWLYEDVIQSIDFSNETIFLVSGKTIVYNDDALVYTRDSAGEYRIFITDLVVGRTIVFKGTAYSGSFEFYNIPQAVQNNSYKQYDPEVIDTPFFQGNVKKVLETRNNLPVGPNIIVDENGVVRVIDIESKFYKRDNSSGYKPSKIHRYNIFIEDVFKQQFSIEDPNLEIDEEQAKVIFETTYGYGLTGVNYNITIDETAKLEETTADPTVQVISGLIDHTETCDRKAECQLIPCYEDTRKYYDYPDIQLTSGFIITASVPISINLPGQQNIQAYFNISSSPNTYVMPLLPILNSTGSPAVASDIIIYVNGLQVLDAVQNIDPWSGAINLNFLPPANSTIRVDYYNSNRYPSPQTYIEHVGQTLSSSRLQWPYPLIETGLYGDTHDFQVDKYPILNQQGDLAQPSDILLSLGTLGITGIITSKIPFNGVDILISNGSVTGIKTGDTLTIDAESYFNNTFTYSVAGITGYNGIVLTKNFGVDISPSGFPFEAVRFTGTIDTIDAVRPLLGHIHLTGAPATGTFVKFDYYYSPFNRTYTQIPDVFGVTGPYMNQGYTTDTFYGNFDGYTLVVDQGFTGYQDPIFDYNQVKKIGYRYRAFNLSNSSVLDSKDTLKLDGYSKNDGRASWANNHNKLNQYDLLFSPEYLTDEDKNIVLNDKYLEKDLDPVTKLYPGSVPFVKTFTDDAHYVNNIYPESVSTYQNPTPATYDIPAGFSIIGVDASGLIDHQPVCEFDKNKRIRLYSGLKVVEKDIDGFDGSLSSITEGQRTIPFSALYIETYYPNREMRLNDYLDYINKVPDEDSTGTLKIIKGSNIAKKVQGIWFNLRVGDTFKVLNIPYQEYNTGTQSWEILYKNVYYTIINVIDYETVEFTNIFKDMSGEYDYELHRDTVYNVDVSLNQVVKELALDSSTDYIAYGLTGLPGYGNTGLNYGIHFPDPGLEPYPRSPWNPNITGLPTWNRFGVSGLHHETGLGPTDLSKIPLVGEIIGADGKTVYYTGMLSGYTGPSGAVNLGLTGPTDDNDPRVIDGSDKYFIPSGDTGIFLAYSESEYRVNWRNWDQAMMFIHVTSGLSGIRGITGFQWICGVTGTTSWGIKYV